jgi:hypothetical protein
MQLKSLLSGKRVPAPKSLADRYSDLAPFVNPQ